MVNPGWKETQAHDGLGIEEYKQVQAKLTPIRPQNPPGLGSVGVRVPPPAPYRLFSRESLDLTIRDSLIFFEKIPHGYVRL